MKITFRRDIYELMVESIERDDDTYLDDTEKEIVLCVLNHFFDVNNWSEFHNIDIDLKTFNKYYKDVYKKHYTELESKYMVKKLKKEKKKNES